MASCVPCEKMGTMGKLMDDPPRRETVEPALNSLYRRFWKDCADGWNVFMVSGRGPGMESWVLGDAHGKSKRLPGVYEFGLSLRHRGEPVVVPVYVGKATKVKERHLSYVRDGSHLRKYFEQSVEQGYVVWMRARYLVRWLCVVLFLLPTRVTCSPLGAGQCGPGRAMGSQVSGGI